MFSLNHYKGFSVLRTFTQDETSLVICNMAYKIHKCDLENKKSYYHTVQSQSFKIDDANNTETEENTILSNLEKSESSLSLMEENSEITTSTVDKDYCSVIKKVKKENITPDNIGEIMLCQIPGISSITALAIMSKFKTFPNLISQIQENENCLKDISYTNAKNQVRKVNKTCLVNIVKFLLKK